MEYPIDSLPYEESEDPEIADAILEHVHETAELIQRLRADGWLLTLSWGPDEATYVITHPAFKTAAEANGRVRELHIKRIRCCDVP